MSLQEYRLWRTYWVSIAVIAGILLFNLMLAFDVAILQSWTTSWITADIFVPIVYGATAFSLPFWVLGGIAHHKLKESGR